MTDYSESLIRSLIKKVKEYPRFSKARNREILLDGSPWT